MYETVKKWYEDFDEEYDNIVNGLKEAAKMIFEKQKYDDQLYRKRRNT